MHTVSSLDEALALLKPNYIAGASRQGIRINALCRYCDQQFIVDRFRDAYKVDLLITHTAEHYKYLCRFCDAPVRPRMLAEAKASLARSKVKSVTLSDFLFCSDECIRAKYWG